MERLAKEKRKLQEQLDTANERAEEPKKASSTNGCQMRSSTPSTKFMRKPPLRTSRSRTSDKKSLSSVRKLVEKHQRS